MAQGRSNYHNQNNSSNRGGQPQWQLLPAAAGRPRSQQVARVGGGGAGLRKERLLATELRSDWPGCAQEAGLSAAPARDWPPRVASSRGRGPRRAAGGSKQLLGCCCSGSDSRLGAARTRHGACRASAPAAPPVRAPAALRGELAGAAAGREEPDRWGGPRVGARRAAPGAQPRRCLDSLRRRARAVHRGRFPAPAPAASPRDASRTPEARWHRNSGPGLARSPPPGCIPRVALPSLGPRSCLQSLTPEWPKGKRRTPDDSCLTRKERVPGWCRRGDGEASLGPQGLAG